MTQASLLNNPTSNHKYGRFLLLKCLVKFLHRVVLSWDVFRGWLDSKSWWCFQSHDGSMGRLFIYIHLVWIDGKCRWCIILHGSFVFFLMFNFHFYFSWNDPTFRSAPYFSRSFHHTGRLTVESSHARGLQAQATPAVWCTALKRQMSGRWFKWFFNIFYFHPENWKNSHFD